jgi:isopenicillin-N epimerase
MLRRREFIERAALAAGLFGLPSRYTQEILSQKTPPLPPGDLFDSDPERYWTELRRQWLLAPDRINLNCGSLGCTPLPVLRAMIDHVLSAEEFREPDYPWFGYDENSRLREVRDALSAFLNVKRDELALVRNATEANNVVANGLDLKSGDEVLLTDQEHPGGRCAWEQKAARYGVKLALVSLPKPPATPEQIVQLFEDAVTPRTRIIVFSHITTTTGLVLPAKEICAMARRRGILTHVDGAHAIGQIPLDLRDVGCDFYATSPHKWLMAPKGTGTLFIREERQRNLWVNIATANWNNYDLNAYRFSWLGTSNLSVMVGLKAALDFFDTVGPARIYRRAHQLASEVRDRLLRETRIRIVNASADPFYGGMVTFEPVPSVLPGSTKGGLQRIAEECVRRKIRIAGGAERIRISTHIFTLRAELNTFFDALDAGLRF